MSLNLSNDGKFFVSKFYLRKFHPLISLTQFAWLTQKPNASKYCNCSLLLLSWSMFFFPSCKGFTKVKLFYHNCCLHWIRIYIIAASMSLGQCSCSTFSCEVSFSMWTTFAVHQLHFAYFYHWSLCVSIIQLRSPDAMRQGLNASWVKPWSKAMDFL